MSKKCYYYLLLNCHLQHINFMRKYLLMPFRSTLSKQLDRIPLNTGSNSLSVIQEYLQSLATELSSKNRYCILMWDEVSIKPAIQYDKRNDKIINFEDWGTRRTRQFADHALVFYLTIRCLESGNHMALGYSFCKGTTRYDA